MFSQHAKAQLINSILSCDITKILNNWYFEYFRHNLPRPSKMIVSIYWSFWYSPVQKINFIPHFFLKILQRFSKLAVLGNFFFWGGAWPWPPSLMVSTCTIVCCLSAFKKSTSSLLSFGDNANILHTCYFHNFRQAWLWPVKTIMLAHRKRWCLSSCKKSYLSLTSF